MGALVPPLPREKARWGGPRENSGRPPRADWQRTYLAEFERTGVQYLAAKVVNVDWHTVQAERDRNPTFAAAFELARERFTDQLESELLGLGRGAKGNPLPYFALLKKFRPMEYHDKLVSLSATVNVDVTATAQDARALLGSLLALTTPATHRLLTAPADDPAIVESTP